MVRNFSNPGPSRSQAGFTLTEILVAGLIIALITISVMTVVRKTRELDITSVHYRRACAIIDSCFESDAFSAVTYDELAGSEFPVVIDDRGTLWTEDDLPGQLTISVTELEAPRAGGGTMSYKRVAATVAWSEPEGAQSVTIYEGVTPL